MAIGYGVPVPKPAPRVYAKRAERLLRDSHERLCRKQVAKRDKGKCVVPGCKERSQHLHHITFRSRGGKWRSENVCSLCPAHHQLVHAHRITIAGNADELLSFTGDHKDLAFRL